MATKALEKGTRDLSIDTTFTEDGAGVLSPVVPYTDKSFAVVGYGNLYLPSRFNWDVLYGTPSNIIAVQIDLEGSLDDSAWFALDSTTSAANGMRFVSNRPVRFVRAKVVSLNLTNGTSTTLKVGISF